MSVCVRAIMYECVCNFEYECACIYMCVCVLPTSSYKIRRSVDNLLQLRRGYDDTCWHRLKWREGEKLIMRDEITMRGRRRERERSRKEERERERAEREREMEREVQPRQPSLTKLKN